MEAIIILAVVISLSIVIIVHESGHFLAAKISGVHVEEFGLGYPPRIFGKKIKGTIYSLNLIPFGGFVKIYGMGHEEETSAEGIQRSFSHKSLGHRLLIIAAGIIANILLGWILISGIFMVGSPQLLVISEVKTGSLAETAEIKAGDAFLDFKYADDLTNFVESNKGKEIILNIQRGEENLAVKITPRINAPKEQGNLGVYLVESGAPKYGIFKSFIQGFIMTVKTIGIMIAGAADLIIKVLTGVNVIDYLAGPVGIVGIGVQAVSSGMLNAVYIFAIISLNLAVFNLLPIPLLDGGWAMFMILEKIRGRTFHPKTRAAINGLAFAFFAFLALIVTIKDVMTLL